MTEASEQVKGHTPTPDGDPCDNCGGYGEVFGHADGCFNDSCALNGDMDSCGGKVEPCPVCAEQPACPRCGGDCSAANPPVMFCPMQDAAISRTGAA